MIDKPYQRELGYKRLKWLIKGGGRLSQTALSVRLGTTAQAVHDLLRRGERGALPSLSMAYLIGYIFAERCAELSLDPAAVDLDEPEIEDLAA